MLSALIRLGFKNAADKDQNVQSKSLTVMDEMMKENNRQK